MSTRIESHVARVLSPASGGRHWSGARRFVGGFYLVMGGINAGILAADPQTYRTFADSAFWPFVTTSWHEVVMASPYVWFLLLAAGEVVLGLLLLHGGPAARLGWAGVIGFHVLLMSFGFGIWLWCLPALAFLVPAARSDWGSLAGRPQPTTTPGPPPLPSQVTRDPIPVGRSATHRWVTFVLAGLVTASSLYGLLAATPYRSLPEATVLGARAQDACSIVVAALLLALSARKTATDQARLVHVGLLGYLAYSYLIYVTGVPMNRMFLVYVAIVALSGAGLLVGVWEILIRPLPSRHTRRLRLGTGWMLLLTTVLFACLWLSTLLPFAFGGAAPDPEGVGGTPYPVFWLDLAITLPAVAAVGVLLLRHRPAGPALAVVALVKIVTLFTALWAGPVTAATTGGDVVLGPDAGPSLVLLAASSWLVWKWSQCLRSDPVPNEWVERP
jgi:hypothetical protein